MSVTTTPETDVCEYCDGEFSLPNDRPNHCDDACYFRDKGDGVLNRLRSDHRICGTCYGTIKTIEPAPPRYVKGPDHAVREDSGPVQITDGIQYATDRMTYGVDEFRPVETDEWTAIEATRWSCVCGAVDPTDEHGIIQATLYMTAATNLMRALADAYRRDAIPDEPDPAVIREALTAPWRGVEYAVGKAVYG